MLIDRKIRMYTPAVGRAVFFFGGALGVCLLNGIHNSFPETSCCIIAIIIVSLPKI